MEGGAKSEYNAELRLSPLAVTELYGGFWPWPNIFLIGVNSFLGDDSADCWPGSGCGGVI